MLSTSVHSRLSAKFALILSTVKMESVTKKL